MYKTDKGFTSLETSAKKVPRGKFLTGFTLIETILTVAMFSVIALAIYSTFSQGVRLWQRLTQRTPSSELNMVFEKMSSDLRNSFGFSGINFVGGEDNITFATLIFSANKDKQKALSLGEVGYSFDAQTGSLNRQQRNYSQVYRNKSTHLRQMLNNVKFLSFRYYYYNPAQEEYVWKDNWQAREGEEERSIPLAVRISLEFDENTKEEEVTRTITIPAG